LVIFAFLAASTFRWIEEPQDALCPSWSLIRLQIAVPGQLLGVPDAG